MWDYRRLSIRSHYVCETQNNNIYIYIREFLLCIFLLLTSQSEILDERTEALTHSKIIKYSLLKIYDLILKLKLTNILILVLNI